MIFLSDNDRKYILKIVDLYPSMLKLEKEDFLNCNVIPILPKYLGQKCSTAKSQKTNNTGLTTFHLQVAKMTFMYSTKVLNREVGHNTYML